MSRIKCKLFHFILVLLAALVLGTCGLEDYLFIYPVPQANITPDTNVRSVVRIPSNNPTPPFSHFVIYYRIYVSDELMPSTVSSASYSQINSSLSSDYNSIFPYIDSTTLVNTNMDNLFKGRGFWYLYLQLNGAVTIADNVLTDAVLGHTLTFDFSSQAYPTMTDNTTGAVYTLYRDDDNGRLALRPDRYFVNNDDLWNSDYINANTNADVVNKSNMTKPDRYTYAALYIAAVGVDEASYSNIYSTPSLIHVFLLPNPW